MDQAEMNIGDIPDAGFIYTAGRTQHIFPLYGRTHVVGMECWCKPKPLPDDPLVVVHEVGPDA